MKPADVRIVVVLPRSVIMVNVRTRVEVTKVEVVVVFVTMSTKKLVEVIVWVVGGECHSAES